MLFMGEEFAASSPFLFFCDFAGDLARAVTEGRRAEFGRFARFADAAVRARIPDPNAVETFQRSKLDWGERARAPHAEWLAFIARLLALRRDRLGPLLAHARSGHYEVATPALIRVRWPLGQAALHLMANLASVAAPAPTRPWSTGDVIYQNEAGGVELPPWFVRVALERPDG
jgi:maltooligosyltrehalose trehalohydrolase